jgi:precorrin-8X/cobalt-precorrin-8 methylmutase
VINNPKEIEAKSFEIIDSFLVDVELPRLQKEVVKRAVHATANLNYAKELLFQAKAIEAGLEAIRGGKNILVDMSMVKAGINKNIMSKFGGKVICLINDEDILRQSSQLNITRAILAMRKSVELMKGGIVAIGNAPTALFELCDLVATDKAKPALIVGIPVGFVGAKEAKKKLRTSKVPYITNRGRKGGSSVAAAIINALLKIAKEKENEAK